MLEKSKNYISPPAGGHNMVLFLQKLFPPISFKTVFLSAITLHSFTMVNNLDYYGLFPYSNKP